MESLAFFITDLAIYGTQPWSALVFSLANIMSYYGIDILGILTIVSLIFYCLMINLEEAEVILSLTSIVVCAMPIMAVSFLLILFIAILVTHVFFFFFQIVVHELIAACYSTPKVYSFTFLKILDKTENNDEFGNS